MTAGTVMIQGTCSSAGKSLLVAALCRLLARRGIRVAPFKAQNMSNNAAVCRDGSEIGRSQCLQAHAAGIPPTAAMNPILLKPEAEARSQVILEGRRWQSLSAGDYYRDRGYLWSVVTTALDRLREEYDLLVIEGAGSPAEVNLQDNELVNMAVARYAGSPVLLVGDIERGGVFAQLLGTLWLLDPAERALVRGLIVNKFRGDPALFADGIRFLEERSDLPVWGVIPWLSGLQLPEEDAADLSQTAPGRVPAGVIDIAAIRLPRIANFDDFDPLSGEPGVQFRYVETVAALGHPDAIILPGTKSTLADLEWLNETGLAERIRQLAAEGVPVVGICGGYQMLGRRISDPHRVESSRNEAEGLRLLSIETVFKATKQTHQVQGVANDDRHCPGCRDEVLSGYEIHMADTSGGNPWLTIGCRNGKPVSVPDGAVNEDGRIWGCYLHGLFANEAFRHRWLQQVRQSPMRQFRGLSAPRSDLSDWMTRMDCSLDRLADALEAAVDSRHFDALLEEQIDERHPATG